MYNVLYDIKTFQLLYDYKKHFKSKCDLKKNDNNSKSRLQVDRL